MRYALFSLLVAGCGLSTIVGERPDAGNPTDGGLDGGPQDGGPSDAGLADAGLTDAGLTDAGLADAGCPMPPTNGNGWAPQLSPDGCHLASGLGTIWLDGRPLGTGWHPVWVTPTRLVFDGTRGDGTEGLMQAEAPFTSITEVTAPAVFNTLGGITEVDAANGVFAVYHAADDYPVVTSTGARFPGRIAPAVSEADGAIAMNSRDDKTVYLVVNGVESVIHVEPMAASDVDIQGDWVVWSAFVPGGRKTHALRRSTGDKPDVTASTRANEFFPILVPVGGDMWLLNYDGGGALPDRLYLRPIDSTEVFLLAQGDVRLPTARYHPPSNRIRVAWADAMGATHLAEVDPSGTRAPLPP